MFETLPAGAPSGVSAGQSGGAGPVGGGVLGAAAACGDIFAGAVVGLGAAVEALAGAEPWRATDEVLLAGLADLTVAVSRIEAQRLRVVREVQDRGCTAVRGGVS